MPHDAENPPSREFDPDGDDTDAFLTHVGQRTKRWNSTSLGFMILLFFLGAGVGAVMNSSMMFAPVQHARCARTTSLDEMDFRQTAAVANVSGLVDSRSLPFYQTELERLKVTTSSFDRYTPLYQRKPQSEEDRQGMEVLRLLSDPSTPLPTQLVDVGKPLEYNESTFRQLHVPVLWQNGWSVTGWLAWRAPVVQWNHAAEIRYLDLLQNQLWPTPPVDCSKQKYIFLPQWPWGFYSRWSILVRNSMISLELADRMLIFGRKNMFWPDAGAQSGIVDDMSHEGIARFFAPISQCQNSEYVRQWLQQWGDNATPPGVAFMGHTNDARPGGVHFETQWVGFGHQLPTGVEKQPLLAPHWIRRAIFDYGEARSQLEVRFKAAKNQTNPSFLHIAAERDARESPVEGMTADRILAGLTSTSLGAAAGLVWKHFDHQAVDQSSGHIYSQLSDTKPEWAYEEFFETLAYAYFFQPLPRVQVMRNLVSTYWTGMIARSAGQWPDSGAAAFDPDLYLSNGQVGAVRIRRGDKCGEDQFCKFKGHFRPAAFFLLALIEEERRVGKRFRAFFLMSDDPVELTRLSAMSSVHSIERVRGQAGPQPESTDAEIDAAIATKDDETIVRAILKGRWIIYNQLAPPVCDQPFDRWSYEAFVTSSSFILHHNVFTVGHENSNVDFFLARVLYVQNQHRKGVVRAGPGAIHMQVKDTWPWEEAA